MLTQNHGSVFDQQMWDKGHVIISSVCRKRNSKSLHRKLTNLGPNKTKLPLVLVLLWAGLIVLSRRPRTAELSENDDPKAICVVSQDLYK